MPGIARVTYRRGMIKSRNDRRAVRTTIFEGVRLTKDLCDLVNRNELLRAHGVHGDPRLGQPIQYDHLEIEHDGGIAEVEVFNRAIMLFATNDQDIIRIQRVCCRLESIDESAG